MKVEINEKLHKEILGIRTELARLGGRLHLIHQEDEAENDGKNHLLWEASQLMQAADVQLQNYLGLYPDGDQVQIDWVRKPE